MSCSTAILSSDYEAQHDGTVTSSGAFPIAIFGATGNIGELVMKELLGVDKDEIPHMHQHVSEIRVVTQRPELLSSFKSHPKLQVLRGNYCTDKQVVQRALAGGCSRMLVIMPQSLSSQDMIKTGAFLGDCAKEAGSVATMVRISSLGIDGQSSSSSPSCCSIGQGPLGDAHVAIETYCQQVLGLNVVSIRPTSFFSNLQFNAREIREQSTMSSPLGDKAKVNWIACEDIAAVTAKVLLDNRYYNGITHPPDHSTSRITVINITGPPENTLNGPDLAMLLTQKRKQEGLEDHPIFYQETPLPPAPDYAGLWTFLRQGGFDCKTETVESITGQRPRSLQGYRDDLLT